MRIDAIDVYYVKHPLIEPWRTAYGEDSDVHAVLVRMRSGETSAWAESSPLYAPTYSPEFAGGVYLLVTEIMAPLIVGQEIDSAGDLLERLAPFKGNPFAKAALEMGWWTLQSALEGLPLYRLLGGARPEVAVGADFGITEDMDELLAKIQGAVDGGYGRVKLKVRPGHDLEMLRIVRRHFPDSTFHIDCNSGYTLDDVPLFQEIDKLGLAMIEQPLFHTDLHDHARLQAALETPVCLDESCSSVRAARIAIEIGACRYMNIKPGRVGGLQPSLEIHDLCREAGIPCWVGGMLESSIGARICLALATLDNFTYPNDIFPTEQFHTEELTTEPFDLSAPGQMTAPDLPGTPFPPRMERLSRRVLRTAHLEA
ncbi:MAG: o-succinylbenzoate synthase [Anaerolineae bacterium]|nr:o-succinylbenzoate synthase [Anaerolineae bacterium]